MDDGGAGEVREPQVAKPSATPGPGADDGIDNARQDQGEEEKGPHPHPFGQRPGNDGSRGRHEDHLEEPVGHGGVTGAVGKHIRRGPVLAAQQGNLVARGAVHKPRGANDVEHVVIHQVVANEEVGQGGDGVKADVLQADHGGVLGAHRAGLQHSEAGAHPHHQRSPDKEGEGVEHKGRFLVHAGGVGHRRPGEKQGYGGNTGGCEDDGEARLGQGVEQF